MRKRHKKPSLRRCLIVPKQKNLPEYSHDPFFHLTTELFSDKGYLYGKQTIDHSFFIRPYSPGCIVVILVFLFLHYTGLGLARRRGKYACKATNAEKDR